jgi:hypothetical protein
MSNPATSIGQTGGLTWLTQKTPAITAAAYSSGQSVGGVQVVENGLLNNSGVLQSLTIADRAAQSIGMTILIFNSAPSAYPDRNTVTLTSQDAANIVAVFSISSGSSGWTSVSQYSISTNCPLGIPVSIPTISGTFWALAIATSAGTFTATDNLIFNWGVLQD